MRQRFAAALLALPILISSIPVESQSTPQNSSPATTDRKPHKVYHVGGDVEPPVVISSPQPSLSEEQIKHLNVRNKRPVSGTTIVSIIVAEDGTVQNAKVLSSFKRDLDAKAIEAVKQWKFEPALKKGVPVAVQLTVEVDFHLNK